MTAGQKVLEAVKQLVWEGASAKASASSHCWFIHKTSASSHTVGLFTKQVPPMPAVARHTGNTSFTSTSHSRARPADVDVLFYTLPIQSLSARAPLFRPSLQMCAVQPVLVGWGISHPGPQPLRCTVLAFFSEGESSRVPRHVGEQDGPVRGTRARCQVLAESAQSRPVPVCCEGDAYGCWAIAV